MQEHNTKGEPNGRYRRETQQKNTTENENVAYNNHIDTDRPRKAIPISPYFCPQGHEKIHGQGNTHERRENLLEAKRMGKLAILWDRVEKNKKICLEKIKKFAWG